MASPSIKPCMVFADHEGNIYDIPERMMVCSKGNSFSLPKPDELMPLPPKSQLFLLPQRKAIGLDPETGELEEQEEFAVSAIITSPYLLTALPAAAEEINAPQLPPYAYAAIGFANNQFYITAKKVGDFSQPEFLSKKNLQPAIKKFLNKFSTNPAAHILAENALKYSNHNAQSFFMGSTTLPLPMFPHNNSSLAQLTEVSTYNWLDIIHYHATRFQNATFSFFYTETTPPQKYSKIISKIIRMIKENTLSINSVVLTTDSPDPTVVLPLLDSGLDTLIITAPSVHEETLLKTCNNQSLLQYIHESLAHAQQHSVQIIFRLQFFPGFSDTENEFSALASLLTQYGIKKLEIENLNCDPFIHQKCLDQVTPSPAFGATNFRKRLKLEFPELVLTSSNTTFTNAI